MARSAGGGQAGDAWPAPRRSQRSWRAFVREHADQIIATDFRSEAVRVLRLPYRSPRANSFAERWVGTARRELLDHLLIFGRRHLEQVLAEFVSHYNQARPHQGLGLRPPDCTADVIATPAGRVERRDRLGGLLHEYRRAACAWVTSGPGATQDITIGANTFAVQGTWSNDTNECEVSHSIVTG